MKRIMKHLLCLIVALLPVWVFIVLNKINVDLSSLVPLSERIRLLLSPLARLEIGPYVLLALMGVVYSLLYLAQRDEYRKQIKVVYGLGGTMLAMGLASIVFMDWIYITYDLIPRIQGIDW